MSSERLHTYLDVMLSTICSACRYVPSNVLQQKPVQLRQNALAATGEDQVVICQRSLSINMWHYRCTSDTFLNTWCQQTNRMVATIELTCYFILPRVSFNFI